MDMGARRRRTEVFTWVDARLGLTAELERTYWWFLTGSWETCGITRSRKWLKEMNQTARRKKWTCTFLFHLTLRKSRPFWKRSVFFFGFFFFSPLLQIQVPSEVSGRKCGGITASATRLSIRSAPRSSGMAIPVAVRVFQPVLVTNQSWCWCSSCHFYLVLHMLHMLYTLQLPPCVVCVGIKVLISACLTSLYSFLNLWMEGEQSRPNLCVRGEWQHLHEGLWLRRSWPAPCKICVWTGLPSVDRRPPRCPPQAAGSVSLRMWGWEVPLFRTSQRGVI